MPELPEVESARLHVHDLCSGHQIRKVHLLEQGGGPRQGQWDDVIFEPPISDNFPVVKVKGKKERDIMQLFEDALLGRRLRSVHRKGKQLWFEFADQDPVAVLFHFGMTGAFVVRDHVIPAYKSFTVSPGWPPKFTKLEMEFDNGIAVAYCDPRRLGHIKLLRNPQTSKSISDLGVDALSGPFPSVDSFHAKLKSFSLPIKALLLDQERLFCGIGNYLVDEILFHAGIHPETKASNINEIGAEKLLEQVHEIVRTAVDADAQYEQFPADWLFHVRWLKSKQRQQLARLPTGEVVVFETCGGRTTAIVPSKQPRYGYYTKKSVSSETEEINEEKPKSAKKRKRSATEEPAEEIDSSKGAVGRKRSKGAAPAPTPAAPEVSTEGESRRQSRRLRKV